MVGSDCYTAPEVFRNKGYDYKADVFGIGIVTFTLYPLIHLPYCIDSVVIIHIVALQGSAFAKMVFYWKIPIGRISRPMQRTSWPCFFRQIQRSGPLPRSV